MKRLFISLAVSVALCVGFAGCNEKEDVELAGITLSGTSKLLKLNTDLNLTVVFFPENTTDRNLQWSSSNTSVATVANGKITAVNEGFSVIKAVSVTDASIYAEYAVSVSDNDYVTVTGAVEGVWAAGTDVYVADQIWVAQGKKLTVEEGVNVLIQDGQVGESDARIEFFVDGSLYMRGSAENPILVTVFDESKRVEANKYAGLWGGIVGGNNFSEILLDHVIVEYTGGVTGAGSQSILKGILEAPGKDQTAAVLTNNIDGRLVIQNSTVRYAASDAIYLMGCEAIVANNIIHTVGDTDNDGINTKAGVKVDIAYNLMFSVNSNGLKLNSKGQSGERDQALKSVYNNTIINSGWRRTKNLKGGSIFIQQNALAYVFNNLILNCKLMTKTPDLDNPGPNDGAHPDTYVGYNFYASGSQQWSGSNPAGSPQLNTAFDGYKNYTDSDFFHDGRNGTKKIDENSLIATAAGTPDPGFVNFGFNSVPLGRDMFDTSWDFHVTSANSPIIAGSGAFKPQSIFTAKEFTPFFSATGRGLMIEGEEYNTPAPKAQYGAHGVK